MLLVLAAPAVARQGGGAGSPAVEVRLIRPESQCLDLLALFEGAAWPHPAAALADWKRSAPPGEERSLGKPLEALIAALNPLMARELATFDGTRILLDPDPDGSVRWAAIVPRDDGTIAALATALALTDGRREAPEGPFAVDRIGPAGAPLLASRGPDGPAILASDRRALASALDRLDPELPPESAIEPGLAVRLDAAALAASGSILARRVAAVCEGLGSPRVEARAALVGEALELVVEGQGGADEARRRAWGAIEPDWLDPVPIDRVAAVVSVAVGPGGDAWEAVLDVVDRVERADPSRSEVVALRQRLALLGLARGVRLEADLWPNLRGITAWLSTDASGALDGGLIALHAPDDPAADRIADRVVSRLLGGPGEAAGALDLPGTPLDGRALKAGRLGPTVLIGWGDSSLAAGLAAASDPARSARPLLAGDELGGGVRPCRLAAAWPSRLPGLAPELRAALDGAPPIRAIGSSGDGPPSDRIRWDGLRGTIRRALEHLPAAPPDAPPTPTEGRP